MAHALAAFIRQRMDEQGLRNRDIVSKTSLSRQHVSKVVNDERERLTRLPEKATIDEFARALGVSSEFLLAKAIESLGLGYTSGDFINGVTTASNAELLREIESRLESRGGEVHAIRTAPIQEPEAGPADQPAADPLAAHDDPDDPAGEAEPETT